MHSLSWAIVFPKFTHRGSRCKLYNSLNRSVLYIRSGVGLRLCCFLFWSRFNHKIIHTGCVLYLLLLKNDLYWINRGSWTSAYGIWNLWNELPDLIFPEPWRGKYSNPVTNFINFICHMHEYKILFITHLQCVYL